MTDVAVLRDMTGADLESGLRLSRASGWNQTLGDWRLLLSLGPGLFRVVVEDGRVVATGGAVRYGRALAWICMVLVDPACRGRGLGTRVFDDVLARVEEARSRDGLLAIGLDATPAGRALYTSRGFVAGPALVRLAVEAAPASPPPPRGLGRAMQPSDLPAVLELDRSAAGAPRAPVLRHALAAAPQLARVREECGRVRAFCLGRAGDHADHVGPVVAEDEDVARELVAECLASPRGRPVLVDALDEPGWIARLAGLGFHPQRRFTRMYLHDRRPPAESALLHAIRGPEFA